jgi:hypothetical protein
VTIPGLHIGTSSFTAAGWSGSFYPPQLKPKEFLSYYYATKFNTVEIDSTYYATPSVSTVNGWYGRTPPDFLFAAKNADGQQLHCHNRPGNFTYGPIHFAEPPFPRKSVILNVSLFGPIRAVPGATEGISTGFYQRTFMSSRSPLRSTQQQRIAIRGG